MVTQDEIAIQTGLARTTVGAILSKRPSLRVRLETRQRVLQTARRLGYRANRHAQIMRGKKSGVLGMIQFGGISMFGNKSAHAVAAAIHASGYEVLAQDAGWYPADGAGGPRVCEAMLDARVEGVILVGASEWFADAEVARAAKMAIPLVAFSGIRRAGVPHVAADCRQGMFELTRHLVGLGHRRLLLSTTWPSRTRDEANCWPILDRIRGFRDAVESATGAGVEGEVVCTEYGDYWTDPYLPGKTAMQGVLNRHQRLDAVLCSNDSWAMGALTACAEAGLRVPEDIALTGYDNDLAGMYGEVALTTVEQPLEAMARKAVALLLKLVRGEALDDGESTTRLPCRLVIRQSCGADPPVLAGRRNLTTAHSGTTG